MILHFLRFSTSRIKQKEAYLLLKDFEFWYQNCLFCGKRPAIHCNTLQRTTLCNTPQMSHYVLSGLWTTICKMRAMCSAQEIATYRNTQHTATHCKRANTYCLVCARRSARWERCVAHKKLQHTATHKTIKHCTLATTYLLVCARRSARWERFVCCRLHCDAPRRVLHIAISLFCILCCSVCYSVLQCFAVCCSVLQCVAVHCNSPRTSCVIIRSRTGIFPHPLQHLLQHTHSNYMSYSLWRQNDTHAP